MLKVLILKACLIHDNAGRVVPYRHNPLMTEYVTGISGG